MDRYIGRDVHASSYTLAVLPPSGKRLGSQVVETNARYLIEVQALAELLFEELDALAALEARAKKAMPAEAKKHPASSSERGSAERTYSRPAGESGDRLMVSRWQTEGRSVAIWRRRPGHNSFRTASGGRGPPDRFLVRDSMNAPIRSPAPADPAPLRVRCWGSRGSIPSPGPETAGFGGNTSCLEVRTADDRCFVFDAGTGIRALGDLLEKEPGPAVVDLFLTHFHWDHIQGLPFFAPFYAAETTIRIHAARQGEVDAETLLRAQMEPVHFPMPYESLEARMTVGHLIGSAWRDDGVEVAWYRTRHPANTYGFRIRAGGASVAYIPDNELEGGRYEVDGPGWRSGLEAFLNGVDLLFHDATFTDEEYPSRTGWGHSTFGQATELAERAGVKRLAFFHHAPYRTDEALERIVATMRGELTRRGSDLKVEAATEGEEIELQGS